jgi:hypothetical protein
VAVLSRPGNPPISSWEERRRPRHDAQGLLIYEGLTIFPQGPFYGYACGSALLLKAGDLSVRRTELNKLWLTERKIICLEPNT